MATIKNLAIPIVLRVLSRYVWAALFVALFESSRCVSGAPVTTIGGDTQSNNGFTETQPELPNTCVFIFPLDTTGAVINNADGATVTLGGVVPPGGNLRTFIPDTINGKKVGGIQKERVRPDGRRTIVTFSVLGAPSVRTFLNDVNVSLSLSMPLFSREDDQDLYARLNLDQIGTAGNDFIAANEEGTIYLADAIGSIPEFPFYEFSQTPFDAAVTPLPEGTSLIFDGTSTFAVPELQTLLLSAVAVLAPGTFGWRRRRPWRRS